MREALLPLVGQRVRVVGTFAKFGSRPYFRDFREETILLEDLRTDDGSPLADHLWFPAGARFGALDLVRGDVLAFCARVRPYRKYQVYRRRNGKVRSVTSNLDYHLAYPTQIRKIAATPEGSI